MLYLITFSTYGTHLRGDPRGSHDHVRNGNRSFIPPNAALETWHRKNLRHAARVLSSPEERVIVRDVVVKVCAFRRWFLYALHVRREHIHAIADSGDPRRMLNDWKAYATRALRTAGLATQGEPVWTRGGSVHIIKPDQLSGAVRYVLEKQGTPMELYSAQRDVSAADRAKTGMRS